MDLGRDRDGRFRVNEFLCHDNSWQPTVQSLIDTVDVVLVDLRGFNVSNVGLGYEIERLVDSVDLRKVVGLMDRSTNANVLQSALDQAAATASAMAPINNGGSNLLSVVGGAQRPGDRRDIAAALAKAAILARP